MNSFSESQRFRQWWLWALLMGTLLVPLCITLLKMPHKINGSTTSAILAGAMVPILIIVLFYMLRLDTSIDEKGIHYRFFPFHFKTFDIEWNEIDKAYVRQYKPILEYGGWGMKGGLGGLGRAYNVSGNMGLQLELKTGKKILFGTLKPDELTQLLNELVRAKVIDRKMILPS